MCQLISNHAHENEDHLSFLSEPIVLSICTSNLVLKIRPIRLPTVDSPTNYTSDASFHPKTCLSLSSFLKSQPKTITFFLLLDLLLLRRHLYPHHLSLVPKPQREGERERERPHPIMGKSPDSSPKKSKKKDVVMGYPPSKDQDQKYNTNQSQPIYPPPPPPPPKASDSSAPSSSAAYQQYPNPYAPYNPYATPSAYQPYPPPYQAAPPYSQPPPPPYNEYYYQQHLRHEAEVSAASFGRFLLVLMFILLSSILMMSLIMWILFGTSAPEFEVGSMKVSNFSATNASVTGAWWVQMWVSNVNLEIDVHFDHGMSSIFYKDSMVGAAALQPFDVRKTQRFGLNFTVPTLQDQRWISPDLAADRGNGAVVVSLRLAVDANFTAPDVLYRTQRLKILCEDLPITFPTAAGEGALSPAFGNSYCFIRIRDGQD